MGLVWSRRSETLQLADVGKNGQAEPGGPVQDLWSNPTDEGRLKKKNNRHEALEQLRQSRPLLYRALNRQQVEPIPASNLLGNDGTDEQEDLDLGDENPDNPPTDFEHHGPEPLNFQTTTQTHGQNVLCPLCTASMGHKHNDTGRDRLRRHALARHLHCADAVVQEYDRQAAVMPVQSHYKVTGDSMKNNNLRLRKINGLPACHSF
ncbi:uncharacterized protein LOC127751256 isoform X2 [Frankliniella occidentalis]|uniref:Uncharacterized protein LOC127751256 isoform X2 n=1 Tax=Frankliniella occidentalis TaxID=133901 RepID=A0A9C6X7B9_FRAOC|nr:uncharacterized protein LOC127751256 isoform X2 [Frankliniella occidentalis]